MTDYKTLSNDQINKAVAKKLGICWHEVIKQEFELYECACGYTHWLSTGMDKHIRESNPDFCQNAKVLLWTLEKKDYYNLFMAKLLYGFEQFNVEADDWDGSIDVDYVKNPRLLAEEFLRWEKQCT